MAAYLDFVMATLTLAGPASWLVPGLRGAAVRRQPFGWAPGLSASAVHD